MTYFSIDIETDGPCPSTNNLLSLGAYALSDDLDDLRGWQLNITPDAGRHSSPSTMKWWASQPKEVWEAATRDQFSAAVVMYAFDRWIRQFPKPWIAVAYPAGFDFSFVYAYFLEYAGQCPFGFQCIDIKTLAWTKLGGSYEASVKKKIPQPWLKGLPPHTHCALDDAKEQAYLFRNIMKWSPLCSTKLPGNVSEG